MLPFSFFSLLGKHGNLCLTIMIYDFATVRMMVLVQYLRLWTYLMLVFICIAGYFEESQTST